MTCRHGGGIRNGRNGMDIKEIFGHFEKAGCCTFATVDENGYPVTRIAHFFAFDGEGLYFRTMRVKPFYRHLSETGRVSACGLVTASAAITLGADGMPVEEPGYFIRVTGDCREISFDALSRKAETEPMFMLGVKDILRYPDMTTFCLWRFKGEIYDYDYEMTARDHKLQRTFFAFGGFERPFRGLRIGPDCIGCGTCMANCTFMAISFGEDGVYRIDPGRCDACGTCRHNCPAGAIEVFQ